MIVGEGKAFRRAYKYLASSNERLSRITCSPVIMHVQRPGEIRHTSLLGNLRSTR